MPPQKHDIKAAGFEITMLSKASSHPSMQARMINLGSRSGLIPETIWNDYTFCTHKTHFIDRVALSSIVKKSQVS